MRAPRFDYPARKTIKSARPGTKRAKVVEMLGRKRGATVAEVRKACGWDERTAREGIRLVHKSLGWGLRGPDGGGRVRLIGHGQGRGERE